MPRKPNQKKEVRVFVVDGKDLRVTFFPPKGNERSWHAYWKGLPTRRSTKAQRLEDAINSVQRTLLGEDAAGFHISLSDIEFDTIQRAHFERMQAKQGSIKACFEAIQAFRQITGIVPISRATADDCARFQDEALKLPKNWRAPFRDEQRRKQRTSDGRLGLLSRQTVLKWSTALSASFNRAFSGSGKKCVRSVVPEHKLLKKNPWLEFSWIEDKSRPAIRQFTAEELLRIVDHFEQKYPTVTVATLAAKVYFWSYARRSEIAGLKWEDVRYVEDEVHFDITGKWRVRKWFRIPLKIHDELYSIRLKDCPFVFGAYASQLRKHHESEKRIDRATKIRQDFQPENFGDWFYQQIVLWAKLNGLPDACVHDFRKTSLQQAVDGDVTNRRVAKDAGVNVGVMTKHYTKEEERQLRQKSNSTFERIAKSLPENVLLRYGYTPMAVDPLLEEFDQATSKRDWVSVIRIATVLLQRDREEGFGLITA